MLEPNYKYNKENTWLESQKTSLTIGVMKKGKVKNARSGSVSINQKKMTYQHETFH